MNKIINRIAGISSCVKYSYPERPVDPNATWHLGADIQPIFNSNCNSASCHGGAQAPDLREGNSFLALSKGGFVKTPGESSRLYLHMSSVSHLSRSSGSDKLKVLYWVNQGALNN
jgi:hypothetical protein